MEIGTVKKSRIAKNRDADETTQLLQVQFAEDEDAQEIEEQHLPGIQYNPPVDSRGFVSRISAAFKVLVGINDNVPKETLEPGERIAYSSDGGAIKAFIKYLKTGVLRINGTGDFAVRYTALETAFDQLKSDHDALLAELKTHVHPGVQTGTGATGTPTLTSNASTADITPAKVTEIEVPA